jgi:hypothetical protein
MRIQRSKTIVLVALMAYFLRALVPLGWMPESAGGATLVICTAQGLSTIQLDSEGNPVEPGSDDGSGHETAPCIFGTTAHYFAPDFGAPHLAHLAGFDRLPLDRSDILHSRIALGPQQARAPPSIS